MNILVAGGEINVVNDADITWLSVSYNGHEIILPLTKNKAQELIDLLQLELDKDISETGA